MRMIEHHDYRINLLNKYFRIADIFLSHFIPWAGLLFLNFHTHIKRYRIFILETFTNDLNYFIIPEYNL